MRQWYFLRRLKNQADWDRHYGRRSYTTIWCTGGSNLSVSYFPICQLPITQLHHHYSMPPFGFFIFKVGLFKPGLDVLLGNPHTLSSLNTDRYRQSYLEPIIYGSVLLADKPWLKVLFADLL
jgi:hypothetical protein